MMKENIARLISNIVNPFLVSVVMLILLALKATSGIADAMKWILITIVISVLPVFLAVALMVRRKKLDSFFSNPREQRTGIYVFASILGIIGCVSLWIIDAPKLLAVSFTAGLIAVVLFTAVNYYWKISLHTAFIAGAVTVLIIVFGAVMAWSLILVPLVGWARMELKQHSLWQVSAGGLLAVAIVCAVFYGFGVA